MELGNLLSKYEELKFEQTGLLFDLPTLPAMKLRACAYCGKPLKLVRDRLWLCGRKKCPKYQNTGEHYRVKKETMNKVKIDVI